MAFLGKTALDAVEMIGQHVELKRAGSNYKGLCPFHTEKTPSFIVNPSRQRYHCFGCGNSGDVIDFVQRLKGLSFKEAVSYLGIDQGKPSPAHHAVIERERRKRDLLREFREWESAYHSELCLLLRTLQKAKREARTPEDVEKLSDLYHQESEWTRRIEVLESGTDEEKYELWREVQRHG